MLHYYSLPIYFCGHKKHSIRVNCREFELLSQRNAGAFIFLSLYVLAICFLERLQVALSSADFLCFRMLSIVP